VLQVVIDDSGRGQEREPAFVLAGYIARVQNWTAFAHEWQIALTENPRIEYLKGSQAFNLVGQFRDWRESERDRKLIALVSLIRRFASLSVTLAVNGKAFDAILRATKGSLRYVRQKLATESRGEVFKNVVWEALCDGPKNLDASLSTEALIDLRHRIEEKLIPPNSQR